MSDNEVLNYLTNNTITTKSKTWPRTKCCNSSRSLYCPECCSLLIPSEDLPPPIRDQSLQLPFDLTLILNDRRTSSSGLHAVALLQGRRIHLVDLDRGGEVPCYEDGRTYLLFPKEGESIPLSSVPHRDISRIVVLDCKWTKSSCRNHPRLSSLPKVHLSDPPPQSLYWRWHNAGSGMLSTLEAIYYASKEVSSSREVIHLFFIFAILRGVVSDAALAEGRLVPFSELAKEERRALRRTIGTEKHQRDIERERLLLEQAKLN